MKSVVKFIMILMCWPFYIPYVIINFIIKKIKEHKEKKKAFQNALYRYYAEKNKKTLNVKDDKTSAFYSVKHLDPLPDFVSNVLKFDDTLTNIILEQRISQINDCIKLIGRTKNPRVFFERYDFLLALLQSLVTSENRMKIEIGINKPSELLKDYIENRDRYIQNFIIRIFQINPDEPIETRKWEMVKKKKIIDPYTYLLSDCHKNQIQAFENDIYYEEEREHDLLVYDILVELFPDEAPKSFSAYRRIKNANTENYKTLINKARKKGMPI